MSCHVSFAGVVVLGLPGGLEDGVVQNDLPRAFCFPYVGNEIRPPKMRHFR